MRDAIARAKRAIDPPIYVSPQKRWKRLGPALAIAFWGLTGAIAALLYVIRF